MTSRLILLILLATFEAKASDECQSLRASLGMARGRLSELSTLEAGLKERYRKYVSEDFTNQIERNGNSHSHESAVKVIFARKRLKSAIEEGQVDFGATQFNYCSRCEPRSFERAAFCQDCPNHPACLIQLTVSR